MAYGYNSNCDDEFSAYPCSACPPKENGRIRGIALILPTTTFSDYSSSAEWANKIATNQVFVIPNTSGTAGVTPVEVPGLGDTEFEIAGYDYVLDIMDRNLDSYADAITVLGNKNMRVGYITSTKFWPSTSTVSAAAFSPVEDDVKSEVRVNWQIKFYQALPIIPVTRPENIFNTCPVIV